MVRRIGVAFTNMHFWQWINDGWVKLTIHPGQELRWGKSYWNGEGRSSELHGWELDKAGLVLTRKLRADGRDCDGRHTEYWEDEHDRINGEMLDEDMIYHSGISYPYFQKVSSGQSDEFAEMMGY